MEQARYPSTIKPILLSFIGFSFALIGIFFIVITLFSSKQPEDMSRTMVFIYGCVFLIISLISLKFLKKGSFTLKNLDGWLKENGFSTKIGNGLYGKKDHFFILARYFGNRWIPAQGDHILSPTSRFDIGFKDTIKIFFQCQAPNCNIFIQKKGKILKVYKPLIPFLAPVKMTFQEFEKMKELIEGAIEDIDYLYCSIHSCRGIIGISMGPGSFKYGEFARINTMNAIKFTENLRDVLNKKGYECLEVIDEHLPFEKVVEDMNDQLFRPKLYFKESKKS